MMYLYCLSEFNTNTIKDRVVYVHTDTDAFFAIKAYLLSNTFSPLNQQSQYKVIYELMCWLSESLTCRLPNMMSSLPARRSRKFSDCCLMFGSS